MSATTDWISAVSSAAGSVGTVAAVVVALWLAANQGREAREDENRKQATQVTAWLVPYQGKQDDKNAHYQGLRVGNASDQLIYDLIAETVSVQGAGRDTGVGGAAEQNMEFGALVGNVPPGGTTTRINTGGGGMGLRFSIEIAFKDAAGRYWLRHGNGTLEQVNKTPVDLYNLPLPLSWEN